MVSDDPKSFSRWKGKTKMKRSLDVTWLSEGVWSSFELQSQVKPQPKTHCVFMTSYVTEPRHFSKHEWNQIQIWIHPWSYDTELHQQKHESGLIRQENTDTRDMITVWLLINKQPRNNEELWLQLKINQGVVFVLFPNSPLKYENL